MTNINDERDYPSNISDERDYPSNISDERNYPSNISDEMDYPSNNNVIHSLALETGDHPSNISDEEAQMGCNGIGGPDGLQRHRRPRWLQRQYLKALLS